MRSRVGVALLLLLSRPGAAAPPRCSGEGRLELAGPEEPGPRFVVSGTVRRKGRAVAGARVLVYHTDARGYYRQDADGKELGGAQARLKGTVCTDAEGRYEFRTIRPAGYPGGGVRPHLHFLVWPADGDEPTGAGHAHELQLDSVKLTRDADGSERVTFDLELP